MIPPRLAVTMGDPAGIGPEIIAKALSRGDWKKRFQPVVIGSERALRRAFEWTGAGFDYTLCPPDGGLPPRDGGAVLVNDESLLGAEIPIGAVDAGCGASAFAWLARAIDWTLEGVTDAIVTAPLHKEALHLAGHKYPGHTEILAERCGVEEFSLMLTAGRFRVVHVTCHVALSEVPALIAQPRVEQTINLFHAALERMDGKPPRIAVCALNPHGGEGGLFGDEEIRAIAPAVKACRARGIRAEGPFPCDSIYPKLVEGFYDGVVAMYHDQGHIAFKLGNFRFDAAGGNWTEVTGVNVTLGLPIVRTSVDHGTAFDLAGTGRASEQSLLDAIEVALGLTGK